MKLVSGFFRLLKSVIGWTMVIVFGVAGVYALFDSAQDDPAVVVVALLLAAVGALLIRGGIRHLKKVMDPEIYGGAPLLGVNGTVIITHGAASHKAIYHAIRVSAECVRQDVAKKITDNLAELDRRRAEDPAAALAELSPALT